MAEQKFGQTNLDAVFETWGDGMSKMYFISLVGKLLQREVYVEDIYHENTPEEWQRIAEAMGEINTEISLRIKRAIEYRLQHSI